MPNHTATPTIASYDEVVITFRDTKADDFGRRHFTAFWLDDNIGPKLNEHGTRGQVFFSHVANFVERQARQGKTVTYTN